MQFNNGKCFLFHHYQNKKDRNPKSMQEQSRGCRFRFPPCLYIIPRVETQSSRPCLLRSAGATEGLVVTRSPHPGPPLGVCVSYLKTVNFFSDTVAPLQYIIMKMVSNLTTLFHSKMEHNKRQQLQITRDGFITHP